MKLNRKGLFLSFLGIVIVIIYFLSSMATPFHGKNRRTARLKACFSNQRVIDGAVSMYNLDNEIPIKTALPGNEFGKCEELLVKQGYLKTYIDLIETDCSYGFIDIVGSGTVFCKNHGSCDLYSKNGGNITLPSYDTSLEVPFSQQYLERRNKCIRELEMRDLKIKISTFLYDIFLSPITGLLLAVALIAADIITNTKKESVD